MHYSNQVVLLPITIFCTFKCKNAFIFPSIHYPFHFFLQQLICVVFWQPKKKGGGSMQFVSENNNFTSLTLLGKQQ